MKATITPMNYVKLTVHMNNGQVSSKKLRSAEQAALHFADMRNCAWWDVNSSKLPRPSGYDVTAARWQKLYRRVLPIFQKYLP